MKKQLLTCFAALSIAAIATSATNSNSNIQQHYSISKTVYDTIPGNHNKNKMDSSGKWKKNKMNRNKNKSGDSTMRNMDSVANPPRQQ